MGERMLRRLRYELYDRILRFPPAHFRKVKQAELATMIKDEVEPLGGFIGDAFVQPMFLGGQALTAIIFIMLQNWLLGDHRRRPAGGADGDHPAAAPAGAGARHASARSRRASSPAASPRPPTACTRSTSMAPPTTSAPTSPSGSGRIFKIRFELYQKKFVAKFWNNILSQATPFAIYLVGGYFAITGQMDVGAVVGVLLAYKDLPSPIKELIDWDQQRQDVQIKYEQVIDQFQPEGMMPRELQAIPDGPPPPLGQRAGAGRRHGLRGRPRQAARQRVAGRCRPTRKLAVIGGSSSGKDVLGQVLARLTLPSGGSIKHRRQGFLPAARVRAGRAHRLCRPGDLPVPAVGARQPAVRPEAPAGRAGQVRRRPCSAIARPFWQRGRARRQSAARSQRRLGRLRAGRRHRPGRPAAAAWSRR